jgi:hypothetical protein
MDRGLLFATELGLCNAGDLGKLLREEIVDIIVDDVQRQRIRARR